MFEAFKNLNKNSSVDDVCDALDATLEQFYREAQGVLGEVRTKAREQEAKRNSKGGNRYDFANEFKRIWENTDGVFSKRTAPDAPVQDEKAQRRAAVVEYWKRSDNAVFAQQAADPAQSSDTQIEYFYNIFVKPSQK